MRVIYAPFNYDYAPAKPGESIFMVGYGFDETIPSLLRDVYSHRDTAERHLETVIKPRLK